MQIFSIEEVMDNPEKAAAHGLNVTQVITGNHDLETLWVGPRDMNTQWNCRCVHLKPVKKSWPGSNIERYKKSHHE